MKRNEASDNIIHRSYTEHGGSKPGPLPITERPAPPAPTPMTSPCPTCKGRRKVLTFWEKPGGLGNAWCPCPECAPATGSSAPAPADRCYENGVRDGLLAASALLCLTEQEIRLACGEMTAQEMLTVKAILDWRTAAIRREAGPE